MNSTQPSRRLLAVASEQAGYFTSKQARDAGYSRQSQRYHVSVGNWLRIHRGVYRLRDFPPQPREDLAVLALLSHNRAGEPQAVISHLSALAVHELSDVDPAQTHLIVPPRFRRWLPEGVVRHTGRLGSKDWEERDGYRVTTPLRTLLDVAESHASQEILDDAVRDAVDRGLVRERALLSLHGSKRADARIEAALRALRHAGTR